MGRSISWTDRGSSTKEGAGPVDWGNVQQPLYIEAPDHPVAMAPRDDQQLVPIPHQPDWGHFVADDFAVVESLVAETQPLLPSHRFDGPRVSEPQR